MVELCVNGVKRDTPASGDCPLLYVLRNDLDLKGSRFGCGDGLCGACKVLVDGRPVNSCDRPIWSLEGCAVTTVEAVIASPEGEALASSFIELQAGQCGYCLSGILVTAAALLNQPGELDRRRVAEELAANLCRCGAHGRIMDAILRAKKGLAT